MKEEVFIPGNLVEKMKGTQNLVMGGMPIIGMKIMIKMGTTMESHNHHPHSTEETVPEVNNITTIKPHRVYLSLMLEIRVGLIIYGLWMVSHR
jgi:hypothetical protein